MKASSDRDEHPLETWSAAIWECDPKGLGTGLFELNDLLISAKLRAKNTAGIIMALEALGSLGMVS